MVTAKKHRIGAAGRAALALAAIGLATGCGGPADDEAEIEGQPTTSGEQSIEWNPCSDLSDEALQATGANPSTKHTTVDGPGDRAAFRICFWDANGGPYRIGVGATSFSQEEMRGNASVTGFDTEQINDRSGLTFYPARGENPIRRCYVNLPTRNGSLVVYADWSYGQRSSMPESPPCGLAVQLARTLEPYLPE